MLSISSFIGLYNNSDLELYFKDTIFKFEENSDKFVVSEDQPNTWSDLRNIYVATRDGKLLGTVTDNNYTRYYGQRICLYIPYSYQRFHIDADLVYGLHQWKMLPSGARYMNAVRPIEGTVRRPLNKNKSTKAGFYVSALDNGDVNTSQLLPVAEHALRHGGILNGFTYPPSLDVATMVQNLTLYLLGEASASSCREVVIENTSAIQLLADSPIFSVLGSDTQLLSYAETARYHLMPVKSPRDRQYYLCDEAKLDKTSLNRLKLRGVKHIAAGSRKYREAISCGYMSVPKSGECAAQVKKVFDFLLSVIGSDDMYVIEPIVYGIYLNSQYHYTPNHIKPMGTSKKYKRLCKNTVISKGIEKAITDKINGVI